MQGTELGLGRIMEEAEVGIFIGTCGRFHRPGGVDGHSLDYLDALLGLGPFGYRPTS